MKYCFDRLVRGHRRLSLVSVPWMPCSPWSAGSRSTSLQWTLSTFFSCTWAHQIVTNDSNTTLQILSPEQNEKILTLLAQPIYFRLVHNQCSTWLLPRSPLRKAIHFPNILHNHQFNREFSNWEIVNVGFYDFFFKAYLPSIIKQIISC